VSEYQTRLYLFFTNEHQGIKTHSKRWKRGYWRRIITADKGEKAKMESENGQYDEAIHEGKETYDMDIDRMINEGLGGGQVTLNNGLISDSTTDTMEADNP
jgi:hypothetical protein